MSGLGGGKLEHPRRWHGTHWPGLCLRGGAELPSAARRALRRRKSRARAVPRGALCPCCTTMGPCRAAAASARAEGELNAQLAESRTQIARLEDLAVQADLDPDFAKKFLNFIIREVIRHHKEKQS
mgnify:CR=1 FL=1